MRARGYSLIEAIIASFLLVSAFFLVSRLFHTGLQYSRKVEGRIVAVQLAEQRMAELRLWAKGTRDWNGFPNTQIDGHPEYRVSTTLARETVLYCPSTQLEKAFPEDDRRELKMVARRANVEITWGRHGRYLLTALLTKGTPAWRESVFDNRSRDEIVISGSFPSPVRGGPGITLTAQGFDENNHVIPGLFFHWSVEPVFDGNRPGVGRITMLNRDGSRVQFTNEIRRRDLPDQPWRAGRGRCRVVCYALYNGQERSCRTEPIELDL